MYYYDNDHDYSLHIYSMFSSDSCTCCNSNSRIDVSVFIHDILKKSHDIEMMSHLQQVLLLLFWYQQQEYLHRGKSRAMEPKVIPLMTVVLLTGLSSREKTGTKTEGREVMKKKMNGFVLGRG